MASWKLARKLGRAGTSWKLEEAGSWKKLGFNELDTSWKLLAGQLAPHTSWKFSGLKISNQLETGQDAPHDKLEIPGLVAWRTSWKLFRSWNFLASWNHARAGNFFKKKYPILV